MTTIFLITPILAFGDHCGIKFGDQSGIGDDSDLEAVMTGKLVTTRIR